MTIRSRIGLWYLGMIGISMLLMLGVLYYELSIERQSRKTPEEPPEQMEDILLHYAVPSALFLIVGGYWFIRRVLAPVTELAGAVEKVNAENLGERLARSGNGDELDRLTASFNSMLDRLAESFSGIREFTLNASHELKTPLTILSGEVQSLLTDSRTTPEHREALAGQLEEVLRLARIVDDLSLLTKADAGLIRLAKNEVALDELVNDLHVDAEALAAPGNIRVECSGCVQATVTGDRDRLRQLLLNLVDNAVKFNIPGGRIGISLRRDGKEAEVRISNTGPSIPATSLPRVFDRFYRGENAMLLQVDGSGLGLSLARWIAVGHGGELSLRTTPEGETEAVLKLNTQSQI
jgi:signal transduction histidine kinase